MQLDTLSATQRNQFLNYEPGTPALQPLYAQIQSVLENEPDVLDLDAVAAGLEDEQAALLFEIAASPDLFSIVEEGDLQQEWKETRAELQSLAIGAEIDEVAKELERLDAQRDLSDEDEARQETLLEKIVRLRQRQRVE